MALDKRIPAVYIDVEDRSLALETPEGGRAGYVVLLSDRGEHNKIVEINSRQELYSKYGKPDFAKHGQGHYLADKFLEYSSRLYVCRPALLDPEYNTDTEADDCMAIANSAIRFNDEESIQLIEGDFTFTQDSNVVLCDSTSLVDLQVGQWVKPTGSDIEMLKQIIDIDTDDNEITLDSVWVDETATTTLDLYNQFELITTENIRSTDQFDIIDQNVLWYFHAIGAGEYYDKVFIKGTRNIELEKMYTDDNGNPLFPNMFMDITVNRLNDDNTTTILEGPWSVSLVDRTPSGQIIRDVFSGTQLYLPIVINENSGTIRCIESLGADGLMTLKQDYPYAPDVQKRLNVVSLFSSGQVIGLNTIGSGGVDLNNGSNGNLFDSRGYLNFLDNEEYQSLVAKAYNGSLPSEDGSVELISQSLYPAYLFNYVLCGGYTAMINNAARTLVDVRDDCLLLADTGSINNSADDEITSRQEDVDWNTWNAALYTQFRYIVDTHTGKRFAVSPVYHAIERHLSTDDDYWISEPVAGIEKGAISEPIDLVYKANVTKLGDLIERELNPVIIEPDGTYVLTQFSTWKRLSIMKRLHVVKFVHFLKQSIPPLLKDILQRKATPYWIAQAETRIDSHMRQYLSTTTVDQYSTLQSYESTVQFDDVRSEINVVLSIRPLRAIERINVNILVL